MDELIKQLLLKGYSVRFETAMLGSEPASRIQVSNDRYSKDVLLSNAAIELARTNPLNHYNLLNHYSLLNHYLERICYALEKETDFDFSWYQG